MYLQMINDRLMDHRFKALISLLGGLLVKVHSEKDFAMIELAKMESISYKYEPEFYNLSG